MKRFRFHPEARLEVVAAGAWYRERSPTAARDFAALIRTGVEGIREHPFAWPLWRGRTDVRHRVLRRFPYSIMYLIEAEVVVILAVAHHKRRPGYWLHRTRR